ncbi:HAD-IC family P-type ATPase [bacterium]|nr:HAD-IC family P-type ATPase [bacterium]
MSVDETTAALDVNPSQGLSADEAQRRLEKHGPNELTEEGRIQPWQILLQQFTEPLVIVLIVAVVVSAGLWVFQRGSPDHEPLPYDSIVILAIVILNALLGFFQEFRAEKAVAALKQMASPESTVRRDGKVRDIPARELTPGDVLLLEAGDRIPADARLVQSANINIEESALTGESVPVNKHIQRLENPEATLGDRKNMVYMGSAVTYGRAEAVVVATGMKTQMGGIATLLQNVEDEETPLQVELARIGKQLGLLVLAVAAIVTVTGVLREGSFSSDILITMFLFGVALAVAAIPEGLPAVVTAVLALGVRRMAERNAIVRRLPAVETLGSATVICSDKTGTLTRNQMTVRRILLGVDQVLTVSGEGYEPEGEFHTEEGSAFAKDDSHLVSLLRGAALNNDARLVRDDEDRWAIEGDPTEGSLLVTACKAGLDPETMRRAMPRNGEIPFSSERKRMATIHKFEDRPIAFEKGAPDVVIELCTHVRSGDEVIPLTDELRERILSINEGFASSALRTLAFASREIPAEMAGRTEFDAEDLERDLIWEGLMGMIDPPRTEAKESVAQAHGAGIRTIMITGDHGLTALAIAKELGIAAQDARAVTGQELVRMDDAELADVVRTVNVYARVNPEHKLNIVRALKAHGEVVAMTGDGVNDAPALRQADIGIAMGITGTDVSKEASDIVLADDNFATIVAAISEGRSILDNIKKFIRYLLSSNAGEVMTMFVGIILAGVLGLVGEGGELFLPLLAVQILWINLVTDGGPALALGIDPAAEGLMARPPRDSNEPVIDRSMWLTIGLVGFVMMLGTIFVLDGYLPGGLFELVAFPEDSSLMMQHARTAAFTTLVMFQMFNVFNMRNQQRSLFGRELFNNRWLWIAVAVSLLLHAAVIYFPPLQNAFDTVPLTLFDWLLATVVASSVVVVMEVVKLVIPNRKR